MFDENDRIFGMKEMSTHLREFGEEVEPRNLRRKPPDVYIGIMVRKR